MALETPKHNAQLPRDYDIDAQGRLVITLTPEAFNELAHVANAYADLVEALGVAIEVADCDPVQLKWATRWRQLLEKLGEEVPPAD